MIDTAEIYGNTVAEKILGRILKKFNFPRDELIVTTKIFFGKTLAIYAQMPPNSFGLSRKHIIEGTKNSLKRLQMDNFDIIFCDLIHTPQWKKYAGE